MKLVANVWIEIEGDCNLNDLQNYLEDACVLDVNLEEEGAMGVMSIEIDWNSLRDG